MAHHMAPRNLPWRCVIASFKPTCYIRTYTRTFATSQPSNQDFFHAQAQDASSAVLASYQNPLAYPQTLTEKIFQRHALDLPKGKQVRSGDFITLSPHRCMTHDNSWPVATKFMGMGASRIHDPAQVVMTLDHDVQNKSESNLKKYRQIQDLAHSQGVDFYPAGHGIGHQIMVEQGYAWPGTAVVASDSHTNMYGGVGCLGTPVVRTGAADIWATGQTWFKVPPVAKVTFKGSLPKGATGKDVIVALCALFGNDEVLNHAIEFVGSDRTLQSLSIDDRLAIANMTTEWGALSGLFPIDAILTDWLRFRAAMPAVPPTTSSTSPSSRFTNERIDHLLHENLKADLGARYAKSLFIDLSSVSPYVAGPNSVKVATPVRDLEKIDIEIDKAYLVSCTNSRASDLAAAAAVFRQAAERGEPAQIPTNVRLYIAAASAAEQHLAELQGDWQVLLNAGATPLPSGCGPCIGLGTGLLEPGEVGISASNRNFKGRMGSTEAKAYLASPEVVAASALRGKICGPGWYEQPENWEGMVAGEGDGIERRMVGVEEALEKLIAQADSLIAEAEAGEQTNEAASANNDLHRSSSSASEIVAGFPERVEGEIVFCDADNINTDGIYPGKYTYQDNVTKDKMAEVCMENYDPAFSGVARPGDILVSGFNFGCGSSREQAATAILAKQIPLVVAGSFGNIFATNSINNALMGLESPKLIDRLRETFSNPTAADAASSQAPKEPEANEQSLDSAPPGPVEKPSTESRLTRRTGWKITWDVRKSTITVEEGPGGHTWEEQVPEIPPNVQKIIAGGGLVKTRQAMFGQ